MTLGDWIITLLILMIPCVNIIMLFVWAFGSSAPKSKANYAKAELIMIGIGIVLGFIITLVMGASMAALISSIANGYNYYG